jgi:hypothetical protein
MFINPNLLAQYSGPTFAQQILPLIAMTFVAGAIWVGLTVMIAMRARERTRRKEAGLAPLPSFYKQGLDWLQANLNRPAPAPEMPPPADVPLPDVDSLTSELEMPDIPDMETFSPAPPVQAPPDADFEAPLEPDWSSAPAVKAPPPPAAMLIQPELKSAPLEAEFSPLAAMPEDAIEIMRVMRDVLSGRLVIDLRGQVFNHPSQMSDPALQSRFQQVLAELNHLAAPASVQARPVNPTGKVPPAAPDSKPAAEGAGIAGQIEAFLQHRLLSNPEYAAYGLHIHPDSGGGVRIEVAGQFYESVNDILEAKIRDFLQKIIQEWSDQHY